MDYLTAMQEPAFYFEAALRARIQANLESFDRQAGAPGGGAAAAVGVVLQGDENGEASFLITRRSSRLRDHAGQWALPGGRLDSGESPEEAALREIHEELDIRLADSTVLGLLDDYTTRSGFVITPVVLWADEKCQPTPNPAEVAEVHSVRLSDLDAPDVPQLRRIPESDRPVLSVALLGTHIHAPTAAVLFQFREVAIHGRATRVQHYDQPVFAWK